MRPLEGYGCTEMGPVISVNAPDLPHLQRARQSSVGRPIPGVVARVVNAGTMEPAAQGEEGLLLVSGPSRMAGYLGEPEKTAAAFRDGFYITGDIAKLDEDGFLHIVDRLSRFSKVGGEMVPHLKVEEALSDVLQQSSCVVLGVPDEQRGERLSVLFVSDDVTPAQLVEHLRSRGLPALWIPKRDCFHRVDAIPTLGTGKVDLRRARAIAMERCAASTV